MARQVDGGHSRSMISQAEQAALNLRDARELRASGHPYRQIRRLLNLTSGQLGHIRRALKREKASLTRLRTSNPGGTQRDLPISRSVLPDGLRKKLVASGFSTLGTLADRLNDADSPGLQTIFGIGAHRAQLVRNLLDHYGLVTGATNLQAEVEHLFPELGSNTQSPVRQPRARKRRTGSMKPTMNQ